MIRVNKKPLGIALALFVVAALTVKFMLHSQGGEFINALQLHFVIIECTLKMHS